VKDAVEELFGAVLGMFIGKAPDSMPVLFGDLIAEMPALSDNTEYVAVHMFRVFFDTIHKLSGEHLAVLQSTDLFRLIQGVILDPKYSQSTVAVALKILQFVPSNATEFEWHRIGEVVKQLEWTEELYLTIVSILSQEADSQICVIENWPAATLIAPILESDFALRFLKLVTRITASSIPLCYKLTEIGFPEQLIRLVTETKSQEIMAVARGLLTDILPISCTRNTFFRFLWLVDRPDSNWLFTFANILLKVVPPTGPFL
jgi:hypothetical protein